MALRFNLPGLLEDLDQEQDSCDAEPCYPYPMFCGLSEEVAVRQLIVCNSLVKLNLRGAPLNTRLNISLSQGRGRMKVLVRLP
ncbi:hypothetical protein [Endozoicomonas sp. 8E]|uniref:hypothetical protein n=1 Tax=Endozoicomonas sp. 8E TaxID=3035692 RepID=UPI002939462B|nr:hypothetical protein [Endozoicomonas sp. 8E]WOG26742.1 hypothetical protein P6910_19665 [Endozoicomonas sp. 8E]